MHTSSKILKEQESTRQWKPDTIEVPFMEPQLSGICCQKSFLAAKFLPVKQPQSSEIFDPDFGRFCIYQGETSRLNRSRGDLLL